MATGTIHSEPIKMVSASIPYSIGAGGVFNASFKTAVDAFIPSGYHYVCIAEWATNEANVMIVNMFYDANTYSLYLKNFAGYSISTTLQVGILIAKD